MVLSAAAVIEAALIFICTSLLIGIRASILRKDLPADHRRAKEPESKIRNPQRSAQQSQDRKY